MCTARIGGSNVALVPSLKGGHADGRSGQDAGDYELVMKVYEKVGSKTPLKVFLEQYPSGLYSELGYASSNQSDGGEREGRACDRSCDATPWAYLTETRQEPAARRDTAKGAALAGGAVT